MKQFEKPKKFDRNLIIIGAGSAGLTAAYIAATVKAKVTLIEKNKMGGDCLNTGCVPSKAFIRSAKFLAQARQAQALGFKHVSVDFNFADVLARINRIIATIEPHDSIERYTQLGVECLQGEAKISSPWTVTINGKILTTQNIIIAAGARPYVPPIPGLETIPYYTSDTIWEIKQLPKHLVVLGGGPIGSELSQCFARFGSKVTQIEMLPQLLGKEDPDISELLVQRFQQEGIDVRVKYRAKKITINEQGEKILTCTHRGQDVRIAFDELLIAFGRIANAAGYGLEDMDISLTKTAGIKVNEYLQTTQPNIFACGDVIDPYQFTHTAAHQAWYAAVNALFGRIKKFKVDYSIIPWATFTDPEIARIGLNETEAKQKNINYETTRYDLSELDRAITDEAAHGVVKILTAPGKDKILGAAIVGEHAGDLITEYVSAMRHNIGLNKILNTIHIYPTLAEANKYAAGNWKKAHAPKRLLKWLERYHDWERN